MLLVEGVDHLGEGLQALFARHLAGGQLHGLNRGQFFRARQTGEHHRHRGGVVEVGVLVHGVAGERGLGLVADGIGGQVVLLPVVGVMRNVTDAAAVDDRRLLLLRQETVELGVVAGGDDQGVDRPAVAVDLDGPVLDDAQVDLYQILLVLVDLVAEMDAAAGHPRQGAAPQIEAVGVVGVGDVQQTLDRLLAKQIHRRGGDLVLGRILAGDRTQALHQRHRQDLDMLKHLLDITAAEIADIVPDVGGTGAQRPVVFRPPAHELVANLEFLGQILHRLHPGFEQIERQYHRVFIGLRLDHLDGAVAADLIQAGEAEGVFAVFRQGEEIAVQGAEILNQEGLAVARLTDQHKGHLLGRAALGRILDERDERIDLIVHADDVLLAFAEDGEIKCRLTIDRDLVDVLVQDHPADALERVFKDTFAFFDSENMGVK